MGFKEDYLFWSMVKQLSALHHYRIITIANNEKEIWLESDQAQNYPVIRLMKYDLDWANWLKRDIERTANNGERIRKKLYKKPLEVLNIYITPFTPVDDFEFIEQPVINQKTTIHTFILDSASELSKLKVLEERLQKPLSITIPAEEDLEEAHVQSLKVEGITESIKKAEAEQQLFQRGKPFITYALMAIQVIVFLLMELNGGSTTTQTLIDFGAKYTPAILAGEWWRFFTPMVVHIGFMHLLMNSLSLYFIGAEVERIYGNTRFLVIYLFAGFAGTLASFISNPVLSAGASGAIFGCFGALLYFGLSHRKLFFRTIGRNVIVLIIINLVYGFSISGIDNAGHIGGLIGGFLVAGMVHLPKSKRLIRQILFSVATIILTYGLVQYGYHGKGSAANSDSVISMIAADYINAGEIDKAYEKLSSFTKENEDAPYSNLYLGNIEYDQGNLESAVLYYQTAIEQQSDLPAAHYYLGIAYYDMNQIDQARQEIEKAVELDPDESAFKLTLEKLNQLEPSL